MENIDKINQKEQDLFYTPTSLLNIFSNTLSPKELWGNLLLKGIFINKNSKEYNGLYYDAIQDKYNGNKSKLTLKIPSKIKFSLNEGRIYTFMGFLEKKLKEENCSFEIQFKVIDVLQEEEETQQIDTNIEKIANLLKLKSDKGFKNIELLLKDKLRNDEKPKIFLIYGNTAIVDEDINIAIQVSRIKYDISENRINLSNKDEIINILKDNDSKDLDVIAIVRGGGHGLGIFEDIEIGESVINLKTPFITAIGHANNNLLIEKLADKSFITPTAFGNYLKDIYENVNKEITNSDAKNMEKFKKSYDEDKNKEITNLKKILEQNFSKQEEQYKSQIKQLNNNLNESKGKPKNIIVIVVTFITIGIIIGLIIGKFF